MPIILILKVDFIYQNLMIEANVINSAFQYGVKKLLFLWVELHLSKIGAAAHA